MKYLIGISSDFTRLVLSFISIIYEIELPTILSMVYYKMENDFQIDSPDIITARMILLEKGSTEELNIDQIINIFSTKK